MPLLTNFKQPWLAIAGLLSAASYLAIANLSHHPGEYALPGFLLLSLLIVSLSVYIVMHFQRCNQEIPFTFILFTAIAFRLIGFSGYPLFEDDFYRYLWDGFQMATHGDPYSLSPAHYFDQDVPELFEEILSGINFPEIATVYGPVCQWLFALAYKLAPGEVWPLQAAAALADIGVLCLLRAMTRHNALLLYAWSPLLIKEFAMTAHPDIVAILFAMIALYASQRVWPLLVGVALAFAVAAKVFAILLLPFLLLANRNPRHITLVLAGFFLIIALITWSFGSLAIWVPTGLRAMAESWLFNAPLHAVLVSFLPFSFAKTLLLTAFSIGALIALIRLNNLASQHGQPSSTPLRGDWLFAGFLLCLPVVNPWYFAWLIPFAVLYPTRWVWCGSITVLLSYWISTGAADPTLDDQWVSTPVLLLECSIILIAVAVDVHSPLKREVVPRSRR